MSIKILKRVEMEQKNQLFYHCNPSQARFFLSFFFFNPKNPFQSFIEKHQRITESSFSKKQCEETYVDASLATFCTTTQTCTQTPIIDKLTLQLTAAVTTNYTDNTYIGALIANYSTKSQIYTTTQKLIHN